MEFRLHPLALVRGILRPIDPPLFLLVTILLAASLMLMQSASPERMQAQLMNTGVALTMMWITARIPAPRLLTLAMPLYLVGVLLLVGVALFRITSYNVCYTKLLRSSEEA